MPNAQRKARSSMRMQSNRLQCAGSCWCKKICKPECAATHSIWNYYELRFAGRTSLHCRTWTKQQPAESEWKVGRSLASVQGFERGKGTSVCGDEELAKMLRSSCKCRGDAINSISWLTCFVWHKLNSRCVSDGFWQNLCGLYHNALDSD